MTMDFLLGLTYSDFERYASIWLPTLLLLAIVYFMWRTLRLMPRTKPQEISSKSKSAVTWADVAGVEYRQDHNRSGVEDHVPLDDLAARRGGRVHRDADLAADVDDLARHGGTGWFDCGRLRPMIG